MDIKQKSYLVNNVLGMSEYEDNYFDILITDLEYGLGASNPSDKPNYVKQKNGTSKKIENVNKYEKSDWDNKLSGPDYFAQAFRVSKRQIIFGGNYYGLTGGYLVWDKLNGNSDQFDCELAWLSFTQRMEMVYYKWHGMFQGVYCGKDIEKAMVQQGNKKLNEKRIHVTQKPILMYDWILEKYVNDGEKVLDTNEGSASLKFSCYKRGIEYVGMENDETMFYKAQERFEENIKSHIVEEKKKEEIRILLSKQTSLFI